MNKKKILIIGLISAIIGSVLTIVSLGLAIRMTGIKGDDLMRFFGVMKFIEARYIDNADTTKLIDGAISGMVSSLDDPNSAYLDPSFYKKLMEYTEGSFGGIGVTMGFKDNKVTIMAVLEDTPGERAGLRAGDDIVAVDGVPTSDMLADEVAMKIRGEAGSVVVLTIAREGKKEEFSIARDIIRLYSVKGTMLEGSAIGYIRIASFADNTGKEFSQELDELEKAGLNSLIIDLRQNPGGLIDSCVEVASRIIPKGTVVSVVERDGEKEVYSSNLEENKYPIVALIDEHSASASEIIAGALQDTGAGTIVGTTSYGKGSVQVVMPLFHSDGLKLTVAKYYTPNGRSIDGIGITPDVYVAQDMSGIDVQLETAKKILQDKQANK